MTKNPSHTLHNGIYHLNGTPTMMVSADYPYYRDDPAHWSQRLGMLRDACLVKVVTFYIPWRHHQPTEGADYDFTGKTQPNRNVLGFMQAVKEAGMVAVAKPGPFIHAETNFGSLPDWVSPTNNTSITAWQNAKGEANSWSSAVKDDEGFLSGIELALPAPFDPIFLAHTRHWLKAVGEQVITPHVHPDGAVIFVQIANEGVYSDGQAPVWEYDYSPTAITGYRTWLQTQYVSLDDYNAKHGTECDTFDEIDAPRQHPEGMATTQQHADYADWGSYAAHYLGAIYSEWMNALNVDLPTVINLNPPISEAYGTDAWLARVEPERYPQVHYGFTNWIGDVSADTSAFDRYLLTAKRVKGINFEENWGFSKLYDASYIEPATSYFQTLLALAGGATGYNIYTGVNTASWDDHLDTLHERPYPDASPILEDGTASYKATVARHLNTFLEAHGTFMLTATPQQPIAFGVVQAHCYASMWEVFPSYGYAINTFQRLMHENGFDYGIVSLDHTHDDLLARYPLIVLAQGDDLSDAIQARLAAYAKQGGRVYIVGESVLPFALSVISLRDVLPALARYPHPRLTEGNGTAWVREHGDEATIIVLIPQGETTHATFEISVNARTHFLRVDAAKGAGAILQVRGSYIVSVVCKGINNWLTSWVIPRVTWDEDTRSLGEVGDLIVVSDKQ